MNKEKEFYAKFRIYYEDTDSGGIVYYANYLKFFERARTEVLRENGISQIDLMSEKNLIFVVTNCNIFYKKAAKLDDLVQIKTIIEKIGASSIKMHQEMFLEDDLLNILDIRIACVDASTKLPKRIPITIKNKLINV